MPCFRVIINANIPDLLTAYPDGLSVQEIVAKTGLEPTKLLRVLRNLASKHCFRESMPLFQISIPTVLTHLFLYSRCWRVRQQPIVFGASF